MPYATVRREDGVAERKVNWPSFSPSWGEALDRLKAFTYHAVQDHWLVRPGGDGLSVLVKSNLDLVDVSDSPWGRWQVEEVSFDEMPGRVRRILTRTGKAWWAREEIS